MSSISSKSPTKNSPAVAPLVAEPAVGKMPGETVRALVSLWLLFHLFGVVLALSNNPNYERQSRVNRRD